MIINGGFFIYTLDDPYIHLAVAENLIHGHYGINADELSSPSSSILFPLLLTLGIALDLNDLSPIIINLLCMLGTTALLLSFLERCGLAAPPCGRWVAAGLAITLLLCLNIIGVAFTGMEHSAHVLAALATVLGLVIVLEEERTPCWLILALIAGPLLRFEGLALTVPALLLLLWRRQWLAALATATVLVASLAAYAWTMLQLGLPMLPSSVMAKSRVAVSTVEGHSLLRVIKQLMVNVLEGLHSRQGAILALLACSLLLKPLLTRPTPWHRPETALAAFGVLAAGAHLMAGKFGWFSRYELYIAVTVAVCAIYIWRIELSSIITRGARTPLILLAMAIIAGSPYLYATVMTPLAANNIYEQQFQMHRFATEFYGAPVAVNDLGWVAYRNSEYVLDLWGLGSETARRARLSRSTPGWIEKLAADHGVGLAMVYDAWFQDQTPASWRAMARLYLGRTAITPAYGVVTFYATPLADRDRLVDQLHRFRPTLPEGVRLEIEPAP